jgi:hypothetical protein
VKGEDISHLKSSDLLRLSEFLKEVENRKKSIIIGAYLNEELIAAAYFIENKNSLYFMKGTSNSIGRKEGVLYNIIDFVIKSYSEKKSRLDFVGSNNKSIADFYKKFGASDKFYQIYKWNKLKAPVNFIVERLVK